MSYLRVVTYRMGLSRVGGGEGEPGFRKRQGDRCASWRAEMVFIRGLYIVSAVTDRQVSGNNVVHR